MKLRARTWPAWKKVANSDSDGHAYTNIAIDQGYRAVLEIFAKGDL